MEPEDSHAQNEQIDSDLLDLLETYAKYQRIRESSGELLKQGYFSLAIARRSAGYRWISPDLHSGRARALATVEVNEHSGSIGHVHRADPEPCDADNDGEEEKAGDAQGRDNGLRRRRGHSSDSTDSTSSEEDEAASVGSGQESGAKRPKAPSADPLLWFGMLVPPALKDAQGQFTQALEQLVQLAELQRQLKEAQDPLERALKAQKGPALRSETAFFSVAL